MRARARARVVEGPECAIPVEMCGVLGTYEFCRRLGFSPEDVFFLRSPLAGPAGAADGGRPHVFVRLTQEDRNAYHVDCGATSLTERGTSG